MAIEANQTLVEQGILSATEILEMEIPEIDYYIEGILRPGGKATLVAKKKMAKSFLAADLGMHVSLGKEFLGFTTLPCNVLYVNFEISTEKLMERVQTIQGVRKFQAPNFRRQLLPVWLLRDTSTHRYDADQVNCPIRD